MKTHSALSSRRDSEGEEGDRKKDNNNNSSTHTHKKRKRKRRKKKKRRKKTVDGIFVARAVFFLKSKLFFLAVMRVLAEQRAVAVSSIHSVHQHFPGPRAGDEVSLHWVN